MKKIKNLRSDQMINGLTVGERVREKECTCCSEKFTYTEKNIPPKGYKKKIKEEYLCNKCWLNRFFE